MPQHHGLSRRRFLQSAALGAAAAWLARPSFAFAAEGDVYGGFKVGMQSYSLRNFDVDTALQQTKKLGLAIWEAFPNHIPMGTLPAHIAEQRARLDAAGVKLMSYGVLGFDGNETKARQIFDFAKGMGLSAISADPNPDKVTFDLLDKLVDEYDIPIAIHNHGPSHRYNNVTDVLKVVENRHPLIGACVDTGHFLRSDEDPVDIINKLGARVFGVHLKDVRSIYDDAERAKLMASLPPSRKQQLRDEGKIFTILGEGELNTVGVLRALRNVGFKNNISLEYEENPDNPLSDIEVSLQSLRDSVAYLDDKEEGFTQLWDGKTFDNWKINENPGSWSIKDGAIVCKGERSHLFYMGSLGPFTDFELKVDVKAGHNSNGGIYFHTQYQDTGWPKYGFETQVNNTYNSDPRKTGSLYAVDDVKRQLIPDDTWWTQHIIVKGKRVIIKIDGKVATDYTEAEGTKPGTDFTRVFDKGTFALQSHDPGSTVAFRNIRVKKLS